MHASDVVKTHDIRFHVHPMEQASQAATCLATLPNVTVAYLPAHQKVVVRYSLEHYTLAELECWLIDLGFHLDSSLLSRLKRALITYCEQVQRDNLQQPERLIKRPREIHIREWQKHVHGDDDDTPEEWRHYR
ncbi:hypothetical protein [Chitinivorax sp. B]|uniref:hypothetical protein n=1 Tax=Chitinivorax sp. B TaxID=2502235 RepID=UPI0010F7203A|nr:hypothetical protein [Chitinivorax sp. B]